MEQSHPPLPDRDQPGAGHPGRMRPTWRRATSSSSRTPTESAPSSRSGTTPTTRNGSSSRTSGTSPGCTNPFQSSRTLTICNGIHSRGVLGAVRCLTDERVRDANERYLAERFTGGRFALLVRVPVVTNETLSPDLQNRSTRLLRVGTPEGRNARMKQPIGGKKIRQKASHSALLQSVEVESPLFSPGAPQVGKLDAIIIPASRRAVLLRRAHQAVGPARRTTGRDLQQAGQDRRRRRTGRPNPGCPRADHRDAQELPSSANAERARRAARSSRRRQAA